jgi:hypothetical protein
MGPQNIIVMPSLQILEEVVVVHQEVDFLLVVTVV